MAKLDRKQAVDDAIASLKLEKLEVSEYLASQLKEYIEGHMTTKMMLQMLDEWYVTEVVKERQGGKTVKVDLDKEEDDEDRV